MAIDFVVNERTRKLLTVTFTDDNGDPANPPATYRIDAPDGTAIHAQTALSVAGGAASLALTPDDNTLQSQLNAQEERIITITANAGTADEANQEIRYAVNNLAFVS